MRTASVLGIVCLAAAPVVAGPLPYPVTMTSSTLTIDITPPSVANPASIGPVNLSTTFSMTIYDNDASETVSNSDTFVFDVGDMSNSLALQTTLGGLITAKIAPGSVRFTDFELAAPGHIAGGATTLGANTYLETTIFTVGAYYTTYRAARWSSPTVSATFQTVGTTLFIDIQYGATFPEIGITIPGYSATIELDYVVEIQATSFIPEPGLGSVVVLGLGSAGAWLRRRQR